MKQQKKGPGRNKKPMTGGAAGYTIPEAGGMVGLSRNGSYEAAARGEIPYLEFGRKKIVPRVAWDRKLGIDTFQPIGDAAKRVEDALHAGVTRAIECVAEIEAEAKAKADLQ